MVFNSQTTVINNFLDSVVQTCNEVKINNWLFQEPLDGNPYARSMAERLKAIAQSSGK